ncbi:MAG: hypothetical protein JW849_04155 [Phycisphaerae bacterium]|nr:hypothetical protein [Phycisphaerae bacterium]
MRIEKVEDCFDGSTVYEYILDGPWTRESIARLDALGTLEYFPEFSKPFFRLVGSLGYQVKGIEGENHCRVILPRIGKEKAYEILTGFLNTNTNDVHDQSE